MADNARCEGIRAERARLSTLTDDMPGKLPPQPGDGPLGRPNPELRRILRPDQRSAQRAPGDGLQTVELVTATPADKR